jgi:hypothetical protein
MTIAFSADTVEITSSSLVAALERAWNAIQTRNGDVPAAFFTVGSGSIGMRGALVLGHFAAGRWTVGDQDGVHEIFIGGEGLRRGAVGLLGTLLHEASHATAHQRGIKDTSRGGRYHNRRFAAIGRELGIDVAQHPVIGWSLTTVPETTQELYRDVLVELDVELTAYRRSENGVVVTGGGGQGDGDRASGGTATPAGPKGKSRNGVAATCGCGRKIRVSDSTYASGPIVCGLCGQAFSSGVDA